MNKTYRLVWRAAIGAWVCVAETARGRGKAGRSGPALVLAVLPALSFAQGLAPNALPTAGQVVAGQAQIQSSGPASLTVQQSSQRAAIDWQSFNIGSAASVQFQQPSAQSVALNRVLGADASQIFGKLSANGQVFLSNPQGIYFAPGAQVDVGGLVATTHRIGLDDFMAGRDVFTREGARAGVLNLGRLTAAPGGYIALLAPEVRNEGVLVANAGTVALAAGEAITLNFGAAGNLGSITVTPAQIKTLVENRQAIMTDGGQVILASRAGDALLGSVVHTGTISASSISTRGGKVVIEGDSIQLAAGSRIEATGATGGGQVLVGGQAKGAGDMVQASTVTMAAGASIDASATQQGDGGTVVLWSNIHDANAKTTAQGQIAARGAGGGNGGFVETSGAQLKIDGIRVDTSAAQGTAGQTGQTGDWLLDPYDLTVDASAASTISTNLGTSNVTLLTTASSASGPGVQNASGSGDITVNSGISWSSGNRLTLDAYRNVNINAAISAGNTGKVTIITGDTAGTGVSGSATGDYSFGLGPSGFAGKLTFGSTAGSAALSIATGGGNAAPSTYTLVYTQANLVALNGQSGNYALANALATSGTYTAATPGTATMITSFGNSGTNAGRFTGLGNTLSGFTITHTPGSNTNGPGGYALFGTNYGTIRDFGVNGAITTSTFANGTGSSLLIGSNNGGTVRNSYVTGSLSMTNTTSAVGALIGNLNWGTVDNSWSSASVSAGGGYTGGLIGTVNFATAGIARTATVSNSYATGSVTSTGGSQIGGLIGGIQYGNPAGDTTVIRDSYATGNVSAVGSYTGGLIGFANALGGGSTLTISNTRATGSVNNNADQTGGLIGTVSGNVTINDSYATGNVTTNNSAAGGFIGIVNNTNGVTINRSYASGDVTASTANATSVGGFIGDATNTTINTSFSSGNVSAFQYFGGFIGTTRNGNKLTDVYATGNVTPTVPASAYAVGGLIGYVGGTTAITNAYSSGITPTANAARYIGGLLGDGYYATLTNVYWDATAAGATGYGRNPAFAITGGGARTTAQLTNGTLPTGFNTAVSANGNPWAVTAGFTPYFSWQFPAGAISISGTAYTSAGAAAGSGTVKLYNNGSLISGGQVRTNSTTGTYTALVGTDTFAAGYKLGGTLTLNGAGAVSGANYTDSPFFSGSNVIGFDLKQGLLLATTADTTNSALQASLGNTFGSTTYAGLTSTLGSALWQYNASGNFTVDTALSHGGSTGLAAVGNLALNAAVTATGSTLMLSAGGTVTEGVSGSISATNLALLGGSVTLNGSNDVATLAGSVTGSLSYTDNNGLTVGSIASLNTGVTAADIRGTTGTLAGIAASGDVFVATSGNNGLTVNSAVQSSASSADSTITLRAGRNLVVGNGVALGGTGSNKTNVVLWSGYNSTGQRGNTTVGSASINTRGGLFYLSGGVGVGETTTYSGVTVGADSAAGFFGTEAIGAQLNGTSISTGGGDLVIKGRTNQGGGLQSYTAGTELHGVTLASGGGDINVAASVVRFGTTSAALVIDGATSISATGNGSITLTGGASNSSNTAMTWSRGVSITAGSGGAGDNVSIKTDAGAITISGSNSNAATTSDNDALRLANLAPATTTLKITSTSGDVSLTGNQSSGLTGSGVQGINLFADGAAAAGAIRLGADGASPYTGNLLLRGSSIAHGSSTTTAGAVTLVGSGSLTIDSPGTAFTQALVLDNVYDIGTSHSALTVGKTTNTADVTNSAARTVAGPINIYGGNLSVTAGASLTSTAAGADILLKATAGITDAASIVTNGGDITLWSNSADATTGGIYVLDSTTLDSRTAADRTAGNTSTASGGGAITLGGGSASTALGSSTVVPTGYATNANGTGGGVVFGTESGVSHNANVALYSGGGDIAVSGQRTAASQSGNNTTIIDGIRAYEGLTIDGGTSGSITMVGAGNYAAANSDGINLSFNAGTAGATLLRTANGNISLTGTAAQGTTFNNGVQLYTLPSLPATIAATGTGSVSLNGNASSSGSSGNRDILLAGTDILAASGAITLTGSGAGTLQTSAKSGQNYAPSLGSKAGSLVTSSSSNITLTDDNFLVAASNGFAFNTSGTATLQSYGNNFATAFNLSPNTFASTVSALTVGKNIGATAHTDTVNMNAAVSIAGPISAYAGTINTSANLATTAAGSDIRLMASGSLLMSNALAFTTAGSKVLLAADTDGNDAGNIYASGNLSVTTNGGDITFGGGDMQGSGYATGYAAGATNYSAAGISLLGENNLNSGGGNIAIRGKSFLGNAGNAGVAAWGVGTSATGTSNVTTLNSGTGTILVDGISQTTAGNDMNSGVMFRGTNVITSANTTAAAITFSAKGGAGGYANNPDALGFSTLNMSATGDGGGITLFGQRGAYPFDIAFGSGYVVAKSGPIKVIGSAGGDAWLPNIAFGQAAGSPVTSSTSDIIFNLDSISIYAAAASVNTSGNVLWKPVGTSFTTAPVTGSQQLAFTGNNYASITIGKSGNTSSITTGALTAAGPITLYGGNLAVNGAMTATNSTVALHSSGAVSQAAAITASNLQLLGGQITLNHSGNNVGTLAASGVGSLSYVDSNALTIGTVGPTTFGTVAGTGVTTIAATNGISASGAVSVATLTGDLTLAQNVATTNTGTSAITLNAGQSMAAGTATGGNIVISGSPAISTGAGGRATLYSGSATGNTSLAALVGSGSGRFRYNSDEATSNYTAALGTGLYGIYRQSINTALVAGSASAVYGDSYTLGYASGAVNGDGPSSATVNGAQFSGAGLMRVGSYSVSTGNAAALVALGYTNAGNSNGTLTITAKALTIGGITAAHKVYDGNTNATVSTTGATYSGLVAGDVVTVTSSGSFADKNVANGKTVTLSSTNGGADAGNYSITNQASTTANITPKALTIGGITAANKVYDGNTNASVSTTGATYGGLVTGDVVTVSSTGSFANKNVANGKTVTLVSSNGGADAGNYTITNQASTTADITPKALTIGGITASDRIYDGSTNASVSTAGATYGGLVAGDVVTVSSTGSFANKNVGNNKTVTLASSNGGADAGNYQITNQASTTADITPKALTIGGITAADRVYDGSTNASVSTAGATYGGLVTGDVVTVSSTGSFANKNAGNNKTVTLASTNGGADAGNYQITNQASTTADITPKALTIGGITASNKVYDGSTSASVSTSGSTFAGLVTGDVVTVVSSGSFGDKNVANGKTVTLVNTNGGADAGNNGNNYRVVYVNNTTSTITPKSVSVSGITAGDKVYDGGRDVTVNGADALIAGLVGNDDVHVIATGLFGDKNAGTGKTVTLNSLYSGADAGNYSFTGQGTTTANITPKALTVSGLGVANRFYDGTTNATVDVDGAHYAGLVSGDDLKVSATGAFANKNVGGDKLALLSSSYSGADKGSITSATNIGNVPGGPGSGPTDVIVLPNPLPTLPLPTPTPGGSGGLGGLPPVVVAPVVVPVAPNDAGFVLAASNSGAAGGEQARADGTQLVVHSLTILSTPAVAQAAGNDFVSVLSFEPFVARTGQLLAIALPRGTFEHSNPDEVLTYEARRSDGSALPDWLRFDGSTRSFSGTAPAGVQPLDITITARDQAGHTARTSIRLAFSS